MRTFDDYTRFNADHTRSITVGYDEHAEYDDTITNDIAYMGLEVLTGNEQLAHVMGVEPVTDESIVRARHRAALKNGDHVFFLKFGEHSAYAFCVTETYPARDWDSACAGILIAPKQAWQKAFPRSSYVKPAVFKEICDSFNERVTAMLNGWIYRYWVEDNGTVIDSCGGFLSQEEALQYASEEYPDITYEEDAFLVTTTYRLIDPATAETTVHGSTGAL
mgnify:FL=1